jgi:hypothetical protein
MRYGGAVLALVVGTWMATGAAQAGEYVWGGKLDLTRGVSQVEGAGGGGLASWALITGNETDDGVGGEVNATYIHLPNYALRAYGVGAGLYDRVELTYEGQDFDTGRTGAKLGLDRGFTFHQDVVGAKVRLFGDAVYDQDRWWPQVSVGAQYKINNRGAVIHAVGGRAADGVDAYVAATKLLLNANLVLDATVRMTRANQFGLLGFGGDRNSGYTAQFEGSAGYLVNRHLLVGAEYRTKPDNLGFARENDAYDIYAALALNKTVSVTAAYVDLGDIATLPRQRGVYVSLQAGF